MKATESKEIEKGAMIYERGRDLFDGIGDLGADAVAGEESGADRSGSSGGEGLRVCKETTSEGSSQELRSHGFHHAHFLTHNATQRVTKNLKLIFETRLERNVLSREYSETKGLILDSNRKQISDCSVKSPVEESSQG